MSNALAVSAVTAVLQYLLNGVYSSLSSILGGVTVSAVAPDIVQTNLGTGSNAALQVNVFLHQVTLNQGWRNQWLPSLAADGATPLSNPPLGLDLHYLLTAYAGADTEAEALLGYAVLLLHLNPVLTRDQIRAILNELRLVPLPTNPLSGVLSTSGLAEQIEMIKIVPATLGREELAWIWTALKADYRPTFAFQASVVLIQPALPASPGLPVLSRTVTALPQQPAQFGAQFAQLQAIQLPPGQTSPAQGNTVTVTGTGLGTAMLVVLSSVRMGIQYPPFSPDAGTVTATSLSFTVPTDANGLPAGVYSLAIIYTDSGGGQQSTNLLPIGIAPQIVAISALLNVSGVLINVTCSPNVQDLQTVSLALGSTAVPAQPFTAPAGALSFQFPPLPSKAYLARLQVDGVDSPVTIDTSVTPPVFTAPFVTVP
jgi:Pvc16 N-terminal domain